jgi:hypothetical protein
MQTSCVKLYRNLIALLRQLHESSRLSSFFPFMHSHSVKSARARRSALAWPAWLRVLAVLPALALLWLAVAWASLKVAPW